MSTAVASTSPSVPRSASVPTAVTTGPRLEVPPGLRGLPPLGLVAAGAAWGGSSEVLAGSTEVLAAEALGTEVLAASDVQAMARGTAI